MNNFIRITPFMHVDDVDAAVLFFSKILGFTVYIHAPDYAYVQRETAGIRIMKNGDGDEAAPPGNRRFMYYIDVRDLEQLLAELKPGLDTLAPGDVFGPKDQTYGQRELMIKAPDGNLVVFGQEIRPWQDSPYAVRSD